MHYLALDTNTWVYLANGTEPARLLHFIKQQIEEGYIILLIPETVINEWDNSKKHLAKQGALTFVREIDEKLDKIKELFEKKKNSNSFGFLFDNTNTNANTEFIELLESFTAKKAAIRARVEEVVRENTLLIDGLFKHESSVIIEVTSKIKVNTVQLALDKKAPINLRNSIADALIVLSFLDYVETNSISNAMFVSHNTTDFCQNIKGKKTLHPDLKPLFEKAESHYFSTISEAINTVGEEIVSQRELQLIRAMQDEADRKPMFCQLCSDAHERHNEVIFNGLLCDLEDERDDPFLSRLEFVEGELIFHEPVGPKEQFNKIEVGYCEWCNTEHIRCAKCDTVNALWPGDYNSRRECDGCGLPYFIDTSDAYDGGENQYRILKDVRHCAKCGCEYQDDGSNTDICLKCEQEYSYGKDED